MSLLSLATIVPALVGAAAAGGLTWLVLRVKLAIAKGRVATAEAKAVAAEAKAKVAETKRDAVLELNETLGANLNDSEIARTDERTRLEAVIAAKDKLIDEKNEQLQNLAAKVPGGAYELLRAEAARGIVK